MSETQRAAAPPVARNFFAVVAAATTVAAPWMLGGEPLTAQWLLLWGAVATLAAGLIVRVLADRRPVEVEFGWIAAGALFFGALFLGQLWFQVGNPSHTVVPEGALWRLVPLSSKTSLPQSIGGHFHQGEDYIPFKNPARYALIFGAVWCYAAGLSLGFIDGNEARRWARCIGLNGIVMAAVCLVHRGLREDLTLWKFQTTFDFTHSPIFFYKNHNGAYLAACLAVVLGLALNSRPGAPRRMWEGGALLLWLATAAVNSRAATAIATLWLLFYIGVRIRAALRRNDAGTVAENHRTARRVGQVVLTVVVLSLAGVVLVKAQAASALARFSSLWSAPIDFIQGGEMRAMQREVGIKLWLDRPAWGWGGGSYVYLFNTYHVRVPKLAAQVYREQPQLHRFYNPTVNCDWIEFLVEYGAIGVSFMLAAVGTLLWGWCRWRGWTDPLSLFLVFGVAGLVLHAYLDYILRNPALLFLGAGSLVAAWRLSAPGSTQEPLTPRRRSPL